MAVRVKVASAHWLRHTAGWHMANSAIDLRYARDNLGHVSIATTSINNLGSTTTTGDLRNKLRILTIRINQEF
ncbi:tyrosine-type recombinase/integrase [Noviherbaspirillum aerium]|uniref:tyrosine-type recombinase/integrase n=1 Tax=Noviherbaspirillum aerium TaxID=2588497 RepID=UPI00124C926C